MTERERDIQQAILREFGRRRDLRLWRANVGAARFGRRVVQFGVPGQADLTGLVPVQALCTCPRCEAVFYGPAQGVRLEIEVKAPRGRQSQVQRQFQAMIERFGGLYILARSPKDVHRALTRIRGE